MTVLFGKKLNQCGDGVYLHRCPGCDSLHVIHTQELVDYPTHPIWGFNHNQEAPTFTPSVLLRWSTPKGHTNENPAPVGWQGETENHCCHYFITDGKISFCGDSTHKMAGKTVDLPDYPVRVQSDPDES